MNTPITQKEVDLLSPGGILATIWTLPTNPTLEFKENRKAIHIGGSVHVYKDEGRKMYAVLTKLLEDEIIKVSQSSILAFRLNWLAFEN